MHCLLRRIVAATLGALLLGFPAAAQDNASNGTVGAPELRGFRLPGTRVVPAETAPAPAPSTPAQPEPADPAAQASAPPARTGAAPQPRPQAQLPAPAQLPVPAQRPVQRPGTSLGAASADAPDPAPIAPVAAPSPALAPIAPADLSSAEDYSGAPAAGEAPPAALDDGVGVRTGTWAALALGLALLAGFLLMQRRRRAALAGSGSGLERRSIDAAPPARVPAPAPARTPAPAAEPSAPLVVPPQQDEDPEPSLELHFEAEKMVASDSQLAVHFKLVVLNNGKGPARNILIEAKMFSASAQQPNEIAAFLATPVQTRAQPLTLAPGRGVDTGGAVMMDRQEAREIQVEGRSLFIPTVVIRLVYQSAKGRSGQAHASYLIGIENPKSPEKMGPFRLDLGPRIYRSIGGRQIGNARSAAR